MAHPIVERVKNLFRRTPSPFENAPRRSLRESLGGDILPEKPGEIAAPVPQAPPEGVDLAALWEEPEDPSSLAMIFSGVAAGAAILILILKLFGK